MDLGISVMLGLALILIALLCANSFQDISQMLGQWKYSFPPQLLTVTGAGNGIDVTDAGMNVINAQLVCGDATALTSLDVKIQASVDDITYVDVTDIDGNTVAFTQITADPGSTGTVQQTVAFQMPRAASASTSPYKYARAYATLVGTSINLSVGFLATRRYDQEKNYQAAPGNSNGNNVIN